MKKLILATVVATSLTGCATVFQGTDQTVNIVTRSNSGAGDTVCAISNSDGTWYANGKADTVTIDRDGSDVHVNCQNDEQFGSATVESSFQGGWLFADLLWDACILTMSCLIDGASGAFFEYPSNIDVYMERSDGNRELVKEKVKVKVPKRSYRGWEPED